MLGSRWIRSGGEDASASAGSQQFAAEEGAGQESFETTGRALVDHVAGAVAKPGVYRMPAGSRVPDAIDRAGGPTRDAAPGAINLAAPLADGQQIQAPAKAPAVAAPDSGATSAEGP